MARYIDADQLIKKIYPMGIGDGMYVINAKAVKFAIDNTPTADVVPKSEFEWLYKQVDCLSQEVMYNDDIAKMKVDEAKSEVAREIFEKIEKCMEHDYISSIGVYSGALELRIAELKKKYTERISND